MNSLRRKIVKSLRVNGLWGTIKLALSQPVILLRDARWTERRNRLQGEFDRQYGTDTGGVIPLSELNVDNPNWVHGVRYGPTSPNRFQECLSMVPVIKSDYCKFTFIDVGSGKGATLLYASDLGFGRVIGVELAETLHEIAQANIARYPSHGPRAEAVCCDATEYQFPEERLIIFASNPFSSEIMGRVLHNLSKHSHEKYFVHENAAYSIAELPDGRFLKLVKNDSLCKVFAGQ